MRIQKYHNKRYTTYLKRKPIFCGMHEIRKIGSLQYRALNSLKLHKKMKKS